MSLQIKTSETSPIRVDFVEGRSLGLTFAPGKRSVSTVGPWQWNLVARKIVPHFANPDFTRQSKSKTRSIRRDSDVSICLQSWNFRGQSKSMNLNRL